MGAGAGPGPDSPGAEAYRRPRVPSRLVNRKDLALIVGGVLGYVTGLTKAILTPIENHFFGLPEPVQVAVFVALIALGVWVAHRRLVHRRALIAQAQAMTSR